MSKHTVIPVEQAFDPLDAEYEQSWLPEAFLNPPEFDLMTGMRSILVFGSAGAGKSALQKMLIDHAQKKANGPLVVSWLPETPLASVSSLEILDLFQMQILDAIAYALIARIARSPTTFDYAPRSTQNTIVWFTQKYFMQDWDTRLVRLAETISPKEMEKVRHLLQASNTSPFPNSASFFGLLRELHQSMKQIEIEGTWVFMEGLDVLAQADRASLVKHLHYLLSTLPLFEIPGLAFKLVVPESLSLDLLLASGVDRNRLDIFTLEWLPLQLRQLVERRLQITLDSSTFTLENLCQDGHLQDWLERYGGKLPRGWLSLLRPLVMAYKRKDAPLDAKEWKELRKQFAPLLRVDLHVEHVYIGYSEISLPSLGYKILRYLYENRHRSCSRSELYYRAYKGLDHEPNDPQDKRWEPPKVWGGVLDTALWRLRQAIEWDAHSPIYLITERKRGTIRLARAV